MVQTSGTSPITDRISNFFMWLWGLLYLFFATIFMDPKKMDINPRSGQFGNGGGGNKNMHGMRKAGPNVRGGG